MVIFIFYKHQTSLKTRNRVLVNIVLNSALFILAFVFIENIIPKYSVSNIRILSLCSLLLIMYVLICAFTCKFQPSRIYFLYLILYIIFIFGHVILHFVFGFEDSNLSYLKHFISNKELFAGIKLSIYSLLALNLGILIARYNIKINKEEERRVIKHNLVDLVNMRKIGFLVVIFSAPFALSDLVSKIALSILGGYDATLVDVKYGISNVGSNIAPFFYLSLLIVLASYQKQIARARCVYIILILYSAIQMLIGARGVPIIQVLVSTIVWNETIKPLKKSSLIKVCAAMFPFSVFIGLLSEVRTYPLAEWGGQIGRLLNSAESYTYVFKAINEMGTAIYPTAASIIYVPSHMNFQMGKTYLFSLFAFIPNLSSEQSWIKQFTDLPNTIVGFIGCPLGGSILEEGYANFGWGAIFFMLIVGVFLVVIDDWIYKKMKNSPIIFPLYAGLLYQILWSVRNNIAPIIIYLIRYILLIYILYTLIINVNKKIKGVSSKIDYKKV